MTKVKTLLDKVIATLCVIIFIAMVLLTTFQVISRYVFNSPSSVSEILTRYSFVWLILLSATYVFGQRDHICISFLRDKFKGNAKKVLNIIGEIVIIIFAATILIYGGGVVTQMNMLQYDSMLKIPTGIIYSIIPVCGVLIIFYSIYNIILYAKEKEQ
jgi:TRAP-type C4-dicarboxylate transport system permease small subunit